MQRSDFSYSLPPELIAQTPPETRSGARMLVLSGDQVLDSQVCRLPDELNSDDLLVVNDTRVIPARLHARKDTGGRVEILLERYRDDRVFLAQLRASKSPAAGRMLLVGDCHIEVLGREGALYVLRSNSVACEQLFAEHGEMPLPPYVDRAADARDRERYQTVFAAVDGAVAAPTAGLHFDAEMLDTIRQRDIETVRVTLHVGAGTFHPVRVDKVEEHQMHSERYSVSEAVVAAVARCRQRGGRVVAVGTTAVRALESAAANGDLQAGTGETALFITPGYQFRVVDALLTNFHLPESTLLMLVSAFAGYDRVRAAYAHAIEQRYRFFSYGDAMWIPQRSSAG